MVGVGHQPSFEGDLRFIGLTGVLFHNSVGISFSSRRAIPTKCQSHNDNVYLLLHWPLGAQGRLSGSLDVALEASLAYVLINLILEVMTFPRVVAVVLVESAILRLVPELSGTLHGVGWSHESFFFDMEKNLRPGRV
ncbi:hypothetical protein BHE74_00053014 [Ensete ventricosum]|nr:hypothetical protein BHE74_00053014 [Ensete ventricosum]RZR86233.1 hypothetical protein BHM03_00013397 [Ensete ventricosum]